MRFDNRVVVITGAGGGLGRSYALLFANLGASVVVNDLGSTRVGESSSSAAADAVVKEVTSKGQKAIANYDSVVDGHKIIAAAVKAFGKIDILVNNAGYNRLIKES